MKKVAIMANSSKDSGLPVQTIDDKYLQPVIDILQALPIIIPTSATKAHIDALLDFVDGIILTGDESNINPQRYGQLGDESTHGPFDEKRDSIALYLVQQALVKNLPLMGICRGIQEINVALGGTLQSNIHQNARYTFHQKQTATELVTRYGVAHTIRVVENTRLAPTFNQLSVNDSLGVSVNSLHEQAIDRLADSLTAVAYSEDGIIEVVEHKETAKVFGVQWHPEYDAKNNPVSLALFRYFQGLIEAN